MLIYSFSKHDPPKSFCEVLMSPLNFLEASRVADPTWYYRCDTERRSHVSLQVGMDGIIRLWEPETTIRLVVSTKCSNSRLGVTRRALQYAIDVWNAKFTGGPSFCQVFEKKEATCQVKIRGRAAGHCRDPKKGETLARAFFPGDHPTIEFFPAAFTEANEMFLPNVFAHELIHVLGVRHYFAREEDGAEHLHPRSVEVGERNEKSISNYFTSSGDLKIQDSDVEALRILYAQRHTMIYGLPVSYHSAIPLSSWKGDESDLEECFGRRIAESVSQRNSVCEEEWTLVDGPAQEASCAKVGVGSSVNFGT